MIDGRSLQISKEKPFSVVEEAFDKTLDYIKKQLNKKKQSESEIQGTLFNRNSIGNNDEYGRSFLKKVKKKTKKKNYRH